MEHLDLKQMGVQEMNASEIKETDGGCPILGALAITLLGAAIYDSINEPDDFIDGFNAVLHPFD